MKKIFVILSLCLMPCLAKAMKWQPDYYKAKIIKTNSKSYIAQVIKILKKIEKNPYIKITYIPDELKNNTEISKLSASINTNSKIIFFIQSLKEIKNKKEQQKKRIQYLRNKARFVKKIINHHQ